MPKRKVRADSKSMADKAMLSASKLDGKPDTVIEKLPDPGNRPTETRTQDLETCIRAAEDLINHMKATKDNNPSELMGSSCRREKRGSRMGGTPARPA